METIKCNSCGAVQELGIDNSNCGYCGEAVDIQKAAKNYNDVVKGEFGNFLIMAETAEEATNYDESTRYYNKILEKDTTYADAWLGKGMGQIYSSKLGDIKMNEALTYWKNAIKFCDNKSPMKLRVGIEINNVVQTFFPNILDHYNEFSSLADSYTDLAERFLVLEKGISYAADICPDTIEIHQTGYDLCNAVIDAPSATSAAAAGTAAASMLFDTLSGNKYAASSSSDDLAEAKSRQAQIKNFSVAIQERKRKYHTKLVKLGVLDESSLATLDHTGAPVDLKNANISDVKNLKTEYYISLVILVFLCAILGYEQNFPGIILFVIIFVIYYYARLNARSKKLFGVPFDAVLKMTGLKSQTSDTNTSGNSTTNSTNNKANTSQNNSNTPSF